MIEEKFREEQIFSHAARKISLPVQVITDEEKNISLVLRYISMVSEKISMLAENISSLIHL